MTENQKPTTDEQIADAKKKARVAAEKRLRDANAEEFRAYLVEEHEARGVEYKPRLSPEEKARQEIARLASEFGISVALDVESIEDGAVEVHGVEPVQEVPLGQRLQAEAAAAQAARVPEGTPVIDADASPEERRARAAEAVFGSTPSAY